jgi:beta-phosphoglucomutase-like phosphatase (HAD superfamily)
MGARAFAEISPLQVEEACVRWRLALDAAESALDAASRALPPDELARHRAGLAAERRSALELLKEFARDEGVSGRLVHLTPRDDERRLLGLPTGVVACIFDLEGVLVGSVDLHIAAWEQTLDEFAATHLRRSGGAIAHFDPQRDSPRHMDGRPRRDGLRSFLGSRGIVLPEGDEADPPRTETVRGLANRKNELLRASIERLGVRAFDGSWQFLETAREAGVRTAVVSASANTRAILERAGLAQVVEACIDGDAIVAEQLRDSPAPDRLLAACRELGIDPEHAAAFETSPAGVAAAREGRFAYVVGIHETGQADALRHQGADIVVPNLAALLEQHLPA